jgi:hypothetical protein
MTQATDTDIQELKTAIANLTSSFGGVREEMRVGFGNVETKFTEVKGQIGNLDTKLTGQITNLETKFDGKFDTVNSRLSNIDINAKITADLSEKVGELKNWKQIAIVVFTASVSAAIAWFVRGGVKP